MLLALIVACCIPLDFSADEDAPVDGTDADSEVAASSVAPPANLGSATASAAARPAWELDANDAPQTDDDVLALSSDVEAPLRDGLLACTVTSFLREERLLQRHQAPDLEASLRWGGRTVSRSGPDNVDRLTISAPLAVLEPEQAISVTTRDRQIFRTRQLASVAISPARLPLEVDSDSVRTRCVYVTRDRLEPLVRPALQEAGTHTDAWEPSVDVESDSVNPTGSGAAAQLALRRAASMVGWDDPRVKAGVKAFDRKYQRHLAVLHSAVTARAGAVGAGWSDAGEVQWTTARLLDPDRLAAEWPNGLTAPWGIAVQVRPQASGQKVLVMASEIGSLQGLQLIDGQGGPWRLAVSGTLEPPRVDMAPTVSGPTTLLFTPQGDGTQIEPSGPMVLRARMEDGWLFQRVE